MRIELDNVYQEFIDKPSNSEWYRVNILHLGIWKLLNFLRDNETNVSRILFLPLGYILKEKRWQYKEIFTRHNMYLELETFFFNDTCIRYVKCKCVSVEFIGRWQMRPEFFKTLQLENLWKSVSFKQPRNPSTDEWINKMWYIQTMEYYSAIKNEIMPFTAIWRDLEMIVLSEVNQTKTNIIWCCLYVEYKKKWYKWTYLQNRKRVTDIENKFMVTK